MNPNDPSKHPASPFATDEARGRPIDRRDGIAKVTGAATFTAEWDVPDVLHAVGVTSDIAVGRVADIDVIEAEKTAGVFKAMTHKTCPELKNVGTYSAGGGPAGTDVMPLQSPEILHDNQWVAVVMGETVEAANEGASKVRVTYEESTPRTDLFDHLDDNETPDKVSNLANPFMKGDPDAAYEAAAVKCDLTFRTPKENHNPIEPHATIAQWGTNDKGEETLKVYDASQYVVGCQNGLAKAFGIEPRNVQVICKYIGGAFGCKGNVWPHVFLAAAAAKVAGRPVRLVLQRQDMYGNIGHRTPTQQRFRLGARDDGTFQSIIHEGITSANRVDQYIEAVTVATRHMYATEAMRLDQKLVRLDTQSPTFMRAPAEAPGMFPLESTIDQLAADLKIDPIDLRKKNEPADDPHNGVPWSGRHILECYDRGAELIGWGNRSAEPRGNRDGRWLVGHGMAGAMYLAAHLPNTVGLTLHADGRVVARCATHEMGTGTTTAQAQVLADLLDVPVSRVRFELGDTEFPDGHVSGGSMTTAGVGGACMVACDALKKKLVELANKHGVEGLNVEPDRVSFSDGALAVDGKPAAAMDEILAAAKRESVRVEGAHKNASPPFTHLNGFSNQSFGAQFCEVGVDEELGLVRVRKFAGCFACGRILNAKTARSQFIGGIVMGLGQALMEVTHVDHRFGRITNGNITEYHVPVNADVPPVEVDWVGPPDFNASPIGAKGVGEIGITGVAAAVANAVYNATGRRPTELPLTPESIMA